MAEPTPYDRQYSFATYQSQHPSDPLPGDELDNELNAVKASMDETQAALGQIQRSDGQLGNATVGLDQLKPEVTIGVAPAVAWAPSTAFSLNASVFYALILYRCTVAHTSGLTFDASKFTALADLSSIAIPSGGVSTDKLADGAVTTLKLADGAVTPAKLAGLPGGVLFGRYSAGSGGLQYVTLGSGLSFTANVLNVSAPTPGDGSIATSMLADAAVTNAKCAAGLAEDNLGFTPLANTGGTITGVIVRGSAGAHLWHGDAALASGKITVSTSSPSGGADGDIWLQTSS